MSEKQLTSHQFARQLLEGPDLPIMVPKVKEYADDNYETGMAEPVVSEMEAIDWNDNPIKALVISYGRE